MKKILNIVLPLLGKGGLLKYIFLGIFSGVCSFLFINSVTRVISLIISGGFTRISMEYVIIFSTLILLFIWTRRTLSLAIINLSQMMTWTLRKQLLSLSLRANYQELISRKTRIRSAILNDISVLTQAAMNIIQFFSALILTIACLGYLASISVVLFLITIGIALIGVTVYFIGAKTNARDLEKARDFENNFLENFNAILDGFKEIYMEPKKGKEIYDKKIDEVANDAYKTNTAAFTSFLNNQITGQILFYILISSILLFFSIILKIKIGDTVSFIFTLLYLLSSIETVMVLIPGLLRAKVSSDHLIELINELDSANTDAPASEKYNFKLEFNNISVKGLEFNYGEGEKSFGIGPIDFEVGKGEVIFVYGGNGSGKTTFIHSVLGLNIPSRGEIKLNDTIINKETYTNYRAIFSVVFSDFYLFNEILAVDHVDIEKWNYYLELFELGKKVELKDNGFSTTDLSTGQRKRLALIATLLEEKPVLVIDEWAADQDPYFRKKFYTEIIPLLKAKGLTIIAITHDDRYYHCADKLYKMDDGNLIEENVNIHRANLIL
ncbi:putative ATP-binding cassette transporter [Pedobacter cryoconitis]|uniref:Putative ATP-binding cassette transporter n=1 Tax=Pedobacter cryoconitis TaxID=188932 RepID=A0A7W8YR41_9SPHI|nr:cyclic peptide export ABC transporter [Pedobacter cryoconitis]MBB5620268.1 putative ATP-binding cassette transporter [Pedobacter cryoconitis]